MCAGSENQLVRLDKLLAERGVGSRKDVDKMIRKGLVEIDGEIVGKSGSKLKVPWDTVPIVDGFDYPPPPLLAAYYKPLGVVSSMRDERNRPDLSSVLPLSWQKSLHPVGRLDADTTGLLLFCRDGDLTHRLLHPKYLVEREYVARVDNGPVDEAALAAKLAAGVETIEDGAPLIISGTLMRWADLSHEQREEQAGPEAASGEEEPPGDIVRLRVTEGKYRMVRRVLANCGHPVLDLHRVRYGEVYLRDLDLDEGESAPIEGQALEWLVGLKPTASAKSSSSSSSGSTKRAKTSSRPLEDEEASQQPPPRDVMAEYEEAGRREWRPPAKLVALVSEEGEVSPEEAVEALRRHEGDVVKALEDVLGMAESSES